MNRPRPVDLARLALLAMLDPAHRLALFCAVTATAFAVLDEREEPR